MSAPARRGRAPRRPAGEPAAVEAGGLVEVRLIGRDADVRRFVEALTTAAGPRGSSTVAYRPTRDGGGTRAYVTVALPDVEA